MTIDQCSECRGIFLDRGELERLVDAEDTYNGQRGGSSHGAPPSAYPSHGAAPQAPYPPQQQHGYPAAPGYGNAYSSRGPSHGYTHGHRRHKGHRRRKSMFDDLFG